MSFAGRCTELAAVLLCAALVGSASGLTFSSSCDRFEIDGNTFGSADGALDFVDDFTSGSLAPHWAQLLGTVTESGGFLTPHDPGTPVSIGSNSFELSEAEGAQGVQNGAGNFVATTFWAATLPTLDREFHFQLYGVGAIIEAIGCTVNNLSPELATELGAGNVAGYSIRQQVTEFSAGTETGTSVSIMPASVTGEIALRISFDDTTDMLTCSFSLDGGATYQSPFAPVHTFNGGLTEYDLLLGAAAIAENVGPQGNPLLVGIKSFKLTHPAIPSKSTLVYKTRDPLTFSFAGNPPLAGAHFNVKLDSTRQCFNLPAAGWTHIAAGYQYKDPNGLYGPVKVAKLRARGHFTLSATVTGKHGPITLVPPNPGIEADTVFQLGNGDRFCGSTTPGSITTNNARVFAAKNAPVAATCVPISCSASGAFLD
jgi:hypothetical protein